MSAYTNTQLLELIKSSPYFATYSDKLLAHVEFTLLPSNTNNTYKVCFKKNIHETYILKIPKQITNSYINRDNEKYNTTLAFKLGLTAEPLFFADTAQLKGVSLSHYLTKCRPLISSDFKQPKRLNQVAQSLRTLQKSKHHFIGDFSDITVIRDSLNNYYEQCSNQRQAELANNFIKAHHALDQLSSENLPINNPVPAHIDLMPDNILIQESTPSKIWLIDWEYSAMASPYWDIATLCHVANFNQNEAKAFLTMVLDDYNQSDDDEVIINLNNYRLIVRSLVDCWRGAFVK